MGTHRIEAVRRGLNGELLMFKLDNGMVLNYSECVEAIEKNLLDGYNVGRDRNGDPSIKSNRDSSSFADNNLQAMPEF
jgi:hypothetical protein